MIRDLDLKELSTLSLEERAVEVLKSFNKDTKIKQGDSWCFLIPLLEAFKYLKDNEYIHVIGETPKSEAWCIITDKGYDFIK